MTKIDIISGFLGAGKTTLIKKLIAEAFPDEKLVLIENEFGKIGIDSSFLKASGIQILEMNSGCICCSLVGNFLEAMKKVMADLHPNRILIEPSGIGKLSDVICAVNDIKTLVPEIELNSFAAVVDASKCTRYMQNFGEFYNNQIEHANTIILSRTQSMTQDALEECISMLRTHNEHAPVVTTPWNMLTGMQLKEAMENMPFHEEKEHRHESKNHQGDDIFSSWSIETPRKFEKAKLEEILKVLAHSNQYGTVLRAKGMLPSPDGSWMYFDLTPGEYEIRDGRPEYTGRLCIIGTDLAEDKLKELFWFKKLALRKPGL